MRTIVKTITTTVGLAVFAATLTPNVFAGCGAIPGKPAASSGGKLQSYLVQAAYRPARFALVADNNPRSADIVGLWSVTMTATSPFSGPFDWGYGQWHSDGTEIFNSGGRSPASENFCLGVWTKTGGSTYRLYHVALSYNATSGELDAMAKIREQVTVDQGGNHYTGTFIVDVYAPDGITLFAHIAGDVTGDRITADQ